MKHARLVPTAVLVLGVAGAGAGLSGCGSILNPLRSAIGSASSPAASGTPAAATTAAPAAASPSAPPAPSTVSGPAPAVTAPAPALSDPWAVVSAYYGDIENGDYSGAWAFLSPSMQGRLGPFSGWAAGYRTTLSTSVSEVTESGDTVAVSITAEQSDGTYKSYSGNYTVDNGEITSAHIIQD